jgi:hypothetical protein
VLILMLRQTRKKQVLRPVKHALRAESESRRKRRRRRGRRRAAKSLTRRTRRTKSTKSRRGRNEHRSRSQSRSRARIQGLYCCQNPPKVPGPHIIYLVLSAVPLSVYFRCPTAAQPSSK